MALSEPHFQVFMVLCNSSPCLPGVWAEFSDSLLANRIWQARLQRFADKISVASILDSLSLLPSPGEATRSRTEASCEQPHEGAVLEAAPPPQSDHQMRQPHQCLDCNLMRDPSPELSSEITPMFSPLRHHVG